MLPSDGSPAAVPPDGDPAAGAAAGPDETLARGQLIGRFVVMRLLGRGAMGEVYAAYDPALARTVAVKLLRAEQGSDSAEGRARLMREAQAIARVSHPNVVVVYEAGMFQERVFIAMEHVEGTTLTWWIHARPRTWPEVLEVFLAAGRGLAAAHERNLVHRDFKPDNVMIGADGQVRVMDFGLVQMAATGGGDAPPGDAGRRARRPTRRRRPRSSARRSKRPPAPPCPRCCWPPGRSPSAAPPGRHTSSPSPPTRRWHRRRFSPATPAGPWG